MKKRIKSFGTLILVFIAILLVSLPAFAASVPAATTDFYVNDFANVFDSEEKEKLVNNAVALANEYDGVQVVITTIKSLDGETVEDYAYDMYNEYGIGKDDMGILILLATQDRKIRVEIGKAMEGYINDSKAGRLMDKHAIPYLKENKFNDGLINLQEALITEIKAEILKETNDSQEEPTPININWSSIFSTIGIILAVIVPGGATIWLVIYFSKKAKEKKEYVENLKEQIEKLKQKEVALVETYEDRMRSLNRACENLRRQNKMLDTELAEKQKTITELEDRKRRAKVIYSDIEEKIDNMIKAEIIEKEKKAAAAVDTTILAVFKLSPSKDNVGDFEFALRRYESLTMSERQYIKSDVNKLKELYAESSRLKAEYERKLKEERIRKLTEERKSKAASVTKKILGIISLVGIVHASDLSRLKEAMTLYDDLDHETQKFVDKSTISKLEDMIRKAKREKEDEERKKREEERRRNSYSSSSSFGGSRGGFGGFGGRSGGGGASRGF